MPEFRMPTLGADMESGVLVEWLVDPGQTVKRGQVVAVVETQKGAVEVEIWDEGVIDELKVAPGTKVPVGELLATLRSSVAQAVAAPHRLQSCPRRSPHRPPPNPRRWPPRALRKNRAQRGLRRLHRQQGAARSRPPRAGWPSSWVWIFPWCRRVRKTASCMRTTSNVRRSAAPGRSRSLPRRRSRPARRRRRHL